MRLNLIGYGYSEFEGYGRFGSRLARALQGAGVTVNALLPGDIDRPAWMLEQTGVSWDDLTISLMPPYELRAVPGRHWLYTMTEGSELPADWADIIAECNVERLIVPCRTNADTFRRGGVTAPIHVIHGGTDPDEFPLYKGVRFPQRPFTVLCLADRATRKGWMEVWNAFYLAFGPSTTGDKNVRLIVKCRPEGNDNIADMTRASNRDSRVVFQEEDIASAYDIYAQADVVALPSHFEGWGMGQRESSMMGVPVITQAHSGLDDGFTHYWAFVVPGRIERIPVDGESFVSGEWSIASVPDIAKVLRHCYEQPKAAQAKGLRSAQWLRNYQTWAHSASALRQLIWEHDPVMDLVTGG